jgi:SLBB domain
LAKVLAATRPEPRRRLAKHRAVTVRVTLPPFCDTHLTVRVTLQRRAVTVAVTLRSVAWSHDPIAARTCATAACVARGGGVMQLLQTLSRLPRVLEAGALGRVPRVLVAGALTRAARALAWARRGRRSSPDAAWFGAGLVTAAAAFLGYVLVAAPALAAQAARPPPRPMPPPLRVQVAGEVAQPGAYDVGPSARVEDALRLAGGPTGHGDVSGLNLAAHVFDGQRVYVPRQSRLEPPPTRTPWPTATSRPTATSWPTATSRPTASAWPTQTPRPTATPRPTSTPRATATLLPNKTPWPSKTPWPTGTPRPARTPSPTRTPAPWPTRTPWPAQPTPRGSDLQLEGARDAAAVAMLVAALQRASDGVRAGPAATLSALSRTNAGGSPPPPRSAP